MSKAARLRELLARSQPTLLVGAHNGLTARLAEEAGFDAVWAGGFEITAARAISFQKAALECSFPSALLLISYSSLQSLASSLWKSPLLFSFVSATLLIGLKISLVISFIFYNIAPPPPPPGVQHLIDSFAFVTGDFSAAPASY